MICLMYLIPDMVSSQLQLHRYATGRESRVVTALTLLKSHLFRYKSDGNQVYPHGSTDTLPFATMGSGSLAAMAVFESKFREGLTNFNNYAIHMIAEVLSTKITPLKSKVEAPAEVDAMEE
ncbi:hypothetical protein GW17_00041517 [Ensete ventricosum]|nr:hypothetical protein GW17_00041517 [Ensete ventricosum]